MAELVHLDIDDTVATITLDSPHNRNALSAQLVRELTDHLATADADDAVHVVLIRAADRVFCSGADLSEASEDSLVQGPRAMVALQRQILTLGKPVVVKIAGPVRAGGLGIVAAADIALVADDVNFALTEVKLGLAPAVVSLTLVPRMSSRGAAYTFLTGGKFTAAEAAETGLVTRAVPAADLDAETDAVVAEIAGGSAQGLRETKALLAQPLVERIDAHGEEMAELSTRLFSTDEAREAMLAFLAATGK